MNLTLILGDQLSHNLSSLQYHNKKNDLILMCEVLQECQTPKHHKKKIVFILSAMRHFAKELEEKGFNICYVKLDNNENSGSFNTEILRIAQKYKIKKVKVTEPSEYRVLKDLENLKEKNIDLQIIPDDRFLCSKNEFKEFAANHKNLVMEVFYRQMRRKYNILLDEQKKPIGGKWNFDSENRKFPKNNLEIPKHFTSKSDKITQEVIKLVQENFADHFGDIEPFYLAVTRKDALKALNQFITERLKNFGKFQDAMIENENFMFHSILSFYLNIGLLDPLEIIKKAEESYQEQQISINNVEGFIRQILGWREFIRGIYWLKMPEYLSENFFDAQNNLPEFYWGKDTKMNCVKQCVKNTKENAYAHHIQRLMVLGNFALLAGIEPVQVNEWYLIVYADAFEWVEMPNVTGMTLFADGGVVATKPYAASGSYISKMSNYCQNCAYDVKEKSGKDACPFNYLYWNFLIKNRNKLKNNHRMTMIYRVLDKFDAQKIEKIKKDSQEFLA